MRRVLGLLTALMGGCATLAPAQVVTTGPVVCVAGVCSLPLAVRPDTIVRTVFRTDTLRTTVVRVDTVVRFVTRVDTILRVDTVRIQAPDAPPVATSGLPPHPRVWMDSARIARLKAQVANNTSRWRNVKTVADAQVAKATVIAGDENTLPDLCLAYLGTGLAKYATRAGQVITGYAVEANDLKYDSGYGVRFKLPLVTMGLDWCFDALTPAQRSQAASWLMDRADWTWPQTNPTRTGGWGTKDVTNNYYWGFKMTGPAALAADGLDPRAAGHIALAKAKWDSVAMPYFRGEGLGGAWSEGTNYESSWRVCSFADAYRTAGIALDPTFCAQTLAWRIHSTMPGGRFSAPLGAQPRDSRASIFAYDRVRAHYALPAADSMAGLMKSWLDLIDAVPTTEFNESAVLADELRYYNPATVAVPLSTMPKGYYAPGAGIATYRQSWTDPNATALVFESGPIANAGARAANGLYIWKGSFWISATANLISASGIDIDTRNYNTLTVGDSGQYLFPGNHGTSTPPVFTDSMVVFRGQASEAYGYTNEWVNTRFVTDFARVVTYLPQQDAIVVVDRVGVKDPTKPRVIRWHSATPATLVGRQFTISNGAQRCVGQAQNGVVGTESFTIGNAGATSYATTITMTGPGPDVFVTVFQCGVVEPLQFMVGESVTVTIGSKVVVVPLGDSAPVVTPPPPPIVTPPPPPPVSGVQVLGSVRRTSPVDSASTKGAFGITSAMVNSGPWQAIARPSWSTVTNNYGGTPGGWGSGTLTWTTALQGRAAGLYVDTIEVTITSPSSHKAIVLDSVTVVGVASLPPPAPFTVVIDTAVRHQVMTGWEATSQAGQFLAGWPSWQSELMDLAVNDLGLTRVRVEVASGSENPVDYWAQFRAGQITEAAYNAARYTMVNDNADPNTANPAGFQWSKLDEAIEVTVLPLRQRLPSLYVNLNYVSFASSTAHANANEYAEFILAAFQHIQGKYGFVPNALEVILEPDNNSGTWNGSAVGRAIAAVGARLAASGFHPDIIAPSVTSMGNAVPWLNAIVAVPGASTYLTDVSYHRYSGVSDANLVAIAARAKALGLRTAMLEHIGSGIDDLMADLTLGNVSAWQQYTLAYTGPDNGGKLYNVTTGRPVMGVRTTQLREVYRNVKSGAVRVGTSGAFTSAAFKNPGGRFVAIVRTTAANPLTVTGLPAGQYVVGFTTDAGISSTSTVSIAGPFTTALSGPGVLSVRGIP